MVKEEYRDIPDTEFVPLKEGIDPVFWGKYEINKLGQFRIRDTEKTIAPVTNKKLVDYPKIIFRSSLIKEKRYAIHRLLAITFLENDNPLEKTEVDHINRDRFDYSLNNLRWLSSSDNKKNRIFTKKERNDYYLTILNNKVVGVSLEKGENTVKVSKDTYDFYNFKTNLDEEIWEKHPTLNISVSTFGSIRFPSGEYTVGRKIQSGGYRTVNVGGRIKRVHTLVAETFLSKRPLNPGEIIDHISTNRTDNSIDNLKVCTQKENMNNPKTKEKFSKKVIQMNKDGDVIKEFLTISEAYESLGLNPKTSSHISDCCKGKMKTYKGYTWKYKGYVPKIKKRGI